MFPFPLLSAKQHPNPLDPRGMNCLVIGGIRIIPIGLLPLPAPTPLGCLSSGHSIPLSHHQETTGGRTITSLPHEGQTHFIGSRMTIYGTEDCAEDFDKTWIFPKICPSDQAEQKACFLPFKIYATPDRLSGSRQGVPGKVLHRLIPIRRSIKCNRIMSRELFPVVSNSPPRPPHQNQCVGN